VTTFTTAADPASLDELEVVDVVDELALPPELQAAANRATAPEAAQAQRPDRREPATLQPDAFRSM
jgi:hypothetical protein